MGEEGYLEEDVPLGEYLQLEVQPARQRGHDHARGLHGVNANVPQYIISKLGLNRDPLAELRQDMSQLDTKGTGAGADGDGARPRPQDGEDEGEVAEADQYAQVGKLPRWMHSVVNDAWWKVLEMMGVW